MPNTDSGPGESSNVAGDGEAGSANRPRAGRRGRRPLVVFRLLLLVLSGVGVAVALVLLAGGHAGVAARVLAGDVLLIFGILMLA